MTTPLRIVAAGTSKMANVYWAIAVSNGGAADPTYVNLAVFGDQA